MMIVRPINQADYPALYKVAVASGHGFMSLPADEGLLKAKISRSESAFTGEPTQPGNDSYLFVLEDSDSGEIVGTSGIESSIGLNDPVYHYCVGKVTHASRDLGICNTIDTLTLGNDYNGATELCSLFLHDAARTGCNGRLLSRCRFLFIAQHAQYFSDTLIANMRGVSDSEGNSPFWSCLQEYFFAMDFTEAVHRAGGGKRNFIADLVPRHPIYVSLLNPQAQAVIGQTHSETVPALKLLQAEGFTHRGYVDIFDAGPVLEAKRDAVHSISHSQEYTVSIGTPDSEELNIVCNTARAGFRATLATVGIDQPSRHACIHKATANALGVEEGQTIRGIPLDSRAFTLNKEYKRRA